MKASAVIKRPSEVSGAIGNPLSLNANVSRLGGASVIVDPALDPTSTNPVENKAIAEAVETISGNVTNLATEVDGKQNKLYYIVNGVPCSVTQLLKTSVQGVEGVLLVYDDGSPAGAEVFFANGNGLNTVLTAVNASIATKQDALTFDSVPTANSQNPVTSGGVYSGLQYVMGELADNVTALSGQIDGKYDASNPNGYISGISGNDVKTALGYTPYNATNPNGYVNATQAANAAPVQSVNGQTGVVSITIPTVPSNVSAFTNDAGYVNASGAASAAPVQSVNGQTGAVSLSIPTVPSNVSAFTNDAGYLTLSTLPIYSGGVSP